MLLISVLQLLKNGKGWVGKALAMSVGIERSVKQFDVLNGVDKL